MDDDLSFGTSIWASSNEPPVKPSENISSSSSITEPTSPDPQFHDFDDFASTAEFPTNDEDFGDFGDFGDPDTSMEVSQFEEAVEFSQEKEEAGEPYSPPWSLLHIDHPASSKDIKSQVTDLLQPLWWDTGMEICTSNEDIRQVEGVGQILSTMERQAIVIPKSRELAPSYDPAAASCIRISSNLHLLICGLQTGRGRVYVASTSFLSEFP